MNLTQIKATAEAYGIDLEKLGLIAANFARPTKPPSVNANLNYVNHTTGIGDANLLNTLNTNNGFINTPYYGHHLGLQDVNSLHMYNGGLVDAFKGFETPHAKELRLLKQHVSILTEALGKYVNPGESDDGQAAREALVLFITSLFKEEDTNVKP